MTGGDELVQMGVQNINGIELLGSKTVGLISI